MGNLVGMLLGCVGCWFAISILTPVTQTPHEQAWVTAEHERCKQLGSVGDYDVWERKFECWNRPIIRRNTLTYRVNYQR